MAASSARRQLRIAQVAPLYESVPPRLYGGTERVVSYLTEELVRAGHRVTLFASGDSTTSAELLSVWERALRLDHRHPEPLSLHLVLMEEVFRRAAQYDVIHFHTDAVHLPLARRYNTPSLATLHGRLDLAGLDALYTEYDELPLVSISNAQRQPLANANWAGTVYHGVPLELHRPSTRPGKYLAFLGRISIEKRVDRAIEIAQRIVATATTSSRRSSRSSTARSSSSSARSASTRRRSSWEMRSPCCSSSTGPSRSDLR